MSYYLQCITKTSADNYLKKTSSTDKDVVKDRQKALGEMRRTFDRIRKGVIHEIDLWNYFIDIIDNEKDELIVNKELVNKIHSSFTYGCKKSEMIETIRNLAIGAPKSKKKYNIKQAAALLGFKPQTLSDGFLNAIEMGKKDKKDGYDYYDILKIRRIIDRHGNIEQVKNKYKKKERQTDIKPHSDVELQLLSNPKLGHLNKKIGLFID